MAGKIVLTHVRFGLGDVTGETPSIQDSYQPRTDQIARNFEGGSFEKTRPQQIAAPGCSSPLQPWTPL